MLYIRQGATIMNDNKNNPSDWEYTNDGYIQCPFCQESMTPDNARNPNEHSPDCEWIKDQQSEESD